MKITKLLRSPVTSRLSRLDLGRFGGKQLAGFSEVEKVEHSPASDVFLVEMEDVMLHRSGAKRYFCAKDEVVSICDNGFSLEESVLPDIEPEDFRCQRVVSVEESVLLLGFYKPIYNNYGHFLIDQLPALYFKDEILSAGYKKILVIGVQSDILRSRILDLISFFSSGEFEVEFRPFCTMRLNRFAFLHGISRHPSWKAPFIKDFYSPTNNSVPEKKKKIFVSREDAGDRRLLAESVLRDELESRGYISVLGSELEVGQAMNLFSSADTVVGVCGASMANIAFCAPGTRVVNIIGDRMDGYWYYDLAATKGLHFCEFRGRADFESGGGQQGARSTENFAVDQNFLLEILDQLA